MTIRSPYLLLNGTAHSPDQRLGFRNCKQIMVNTPRINLIITLQLYYFSIYVRIFWEYETSKRTDESNSAQFPSISKCHRIPGPSQS